MKRKITVSFLMLILLFLTPTAYFSVSNAAETNAGISLRKVEKKEKSNLGNPSKTHTLSRLPQTGEKKNNGLKKMGTSLIIIAIFYWFKNRKIGYDKVF